MVHLGTGLLCVSFVTDTSVLEQKDKKAIFEELRAKVPGTYAVCVDLMDKIYSMLTCNRLFNYILSLFF